MTVELNTLAPKKWVADYSGSRPAIDVTDGVLVGDYAIDNSTSPYTVWNCEDNTDSAPIWVRVNDLDVVTISSSPYTANKYDTVILANCASTSITVNLPAASGLTGKTYHIKKIDSSANAVTVDGNGSETIDGELTQVVSGQHDSMFIVCDSTEWWIV